MLTGGGGGTKVPSLLSEERCSFPEPLWECRVNEDSLLIESTTVSNGVDLQHNKISCMKGRCKYGVVHLYLYLEAFLISLPFIIYNKQS